MALDRAAVGSLVQEQMENLERDYGEADNVSLGAAINVVEVLTMVGEPDEQGNTQVKSDVRLRANIGDPYRVVGLLEQAKHQLMAADEI